MPTPRFDWEFNIIVKSFFLTIFHKKELINITVDTSYKSSIAVKEFFLMLKHFPHTPQLEGY
jgi:hypothetical protein